MSDGQRMKIITRTGDVFIVRSEPGDATRYDYFVFRDGDDDFCFMPRKSAFRFPQRINYWEIAETDEKVDAIAKRENCNRYTVLECVRTINEIIDGVK